MQPKKYAQRNVPSPTPHPHHPPPSIKALLESRLVSLDKNPGLRSFGAVESLRRIIGKVVVSAIKEEVISSVGSLQVYAGQWIGYEVIHATDLIFKEENTDAVLLIDAENAFNLINREAFIDSVKIICPAFATFGRFVSNCYLSSFRLFIIGDDELKFTEGTIQGDPIVRIQNAIATIPLILMILETMHD